MSVISSPCKQICMLDSISGICIGCGRVAVEIAGWRAMSEAERIRIMALLPERLAARENAARAASDIQ